MAPRTLGSLVVAFSLAGIACRGQNSDTSATPMQPSPPAQPSEPAPPEQAQPATPAQQAQRQQPVEPAQRMQPTEPARPAPPARPSEPVPPPSAAEPSEPGAPKAAQPKAAASARRPAAKSSSKPYLTADDLNRMQAPAPPPRDPQQPEAAPEPAPAPPRVAPEPLAKPATRVAIPNTARVRVDVPAGLQGWLDKDTRMQPWLARVMKVIDACYGDVLASNPNAAGTISFQVTMHENARPDPDVQSLPGELSGVVACATGQLMRARMPLFTGTEGEKYVVRVRFSP